MVILTGMTSKVGPKGQVVIPKPIRDRLGIRPGDDVAITERDGETALIRRVQRESGLWGVVAGLEGDPLAALESEHRRELEREESRTRRMSH